MIQAQYGLRFQGAHCNADRVAVPVLDLHQVRAADRAEMAVAMRR